MIRKALLAFLGLVATDDVEFADVFDHTCGATSMSATIRRNDLAQLGTWGDEYSLVTLNEGCGGEPDAYGNIIFSGGSLEKLPLECGTQYVDDNHGKITFWNVVQYTPPNDGSPITRDASGLYNFSCIYDMSVNGQKFELSLSHKISAAPVDTIWFSGQTAEGEFRATMELFQDESYENSFRGSAVTLSLEQNLYVDVSLEAADDEVMLKVIRCWATPTIEADAQVRHTLINDGCPTDRTVGLDTSAGDNSARWKSQMFQFVDESQVWLHCDIQACDSRKYECETTCDARKRRAVSDAPSQQQSYTANILTVGPIQSKERWAESKGDENTKVIVWTVVIGLLIIIGLILGIVYACRMRSASTSVNAKLSSKKANNDWQLYGAPNANGQEKQNPLQQW